MAEKKQKKIIAADSGNEVSAAKRKEAAPVGNPTGLRIGAAVLWLLAVVMELLAVLVLFGKVNITFMPTMWQLIAFLVQCPRLRRGC